MKKFVGYLCLILGLSTFVTSSDSVNLGIVSVAKAAGSGGGPIVLDGMDPVCHASYC